jgi:uncharacterized RDD family membrane protein YckC
VIHDRLTIRTSEGVEFSMPLAGPASRFLAWCIDVACVAVVNSTLGMVLGLVGVLSLDVARALGMLATFIVSIGYAIVLEWTWRGQTVGKRVLGLRVVDASALGLAPAQVVVRNLLRAVDVLPLLYLVGGASMVLGRHGQRLGDIAAGTAVVRTRAPKLPPIDAADGQKYNSLLEHPRLAARLRQRLTPEEAALGLRALHRRHQLEPAARVTLFARLAELYRSRLEFPEESTENLPDEQYVRNVVDVVYR